MKAEVGYQEESGSELESTGGEIIVSTGQVVPLEEGATSSERAYADLVPAIKVIGESSHFPLNTTLNSLLLPELASAQSHPIVTTSSVSICSPPPLPHLPLSRNRAIPSGSPTYQTRTTYCCASDEDFFMRLLRVPGLDR